LPTRKRTRRSQQPSAGNSKPISFRLHKDLVTRLDSIATRLRTTRSHVVALVLHEYVQERGDKEVERMAKKEADNAKVDIFA
jgi:predicted transcriptional regulator